MALSEQDEWRFSNCSAHSNPCTYHVAKAEFIPLLFVAICMCNAMFWVCKNHIRIMGRWIILLIYTCRAPLGLTLNCACTPQIVRSYSQFYVISIPMAVFIIWYAIFKFQRENNSLLHKLKFDMECAALPIFHCLITFIKWMSNVKGIISIAIKWIIKNSFALLTMDLLLFSECSRSLKLSLKFPPFILRMHKISIEI